MKSPSLTNSKVINMKDDKLVELFHFKAGLYAYATMTLISSLVGNLNFQNSNEIFQIKMTNRPASKKLN